MWREKLLILLPSWSRVAGSRFAGDKKQILSVGLFLFGFILLGSGLIYSIKSNENNTKEEISFESANTANSSENKAPKITVDVEGSVVSPGIYNLDQSARVKDALIAAGGLSSDADRDWVAKNLNLASKLSDSGKVYIPRKGDPSSLRSSGQETSVSNLININSATIKELDSLPGIGAVTAQKIIDGRPYNSINDLINRKILKSSVFEKIKDKIIY